MDQRVACLMGVDESLKWMKGVKHCAFGGGKKCARPDAHVRGGGGVGWSPT
jgi:hypothetical protein